MTETRLYSAIVSINSAEVVGQYVADFLYDKTTAELPLDVVGFDITDTDDFSDPTQPFTGRSVPKFTTPLANKLTWKNTDNSDLESAFFGNISRAGLAHEGLVLTEGQVSLDAMHIRGEHHSAFNTVFNEPTAIQVACLSLSSDRYRARTELTDNKRCWIDIFPLVGSLVLHSETVHVRSKDLNYKHFTNKT